MSTINHIYLVVRGAAPVPPAVLAPRVSPFRMPPKKVSDVVQAKTKDYKGVRIPVDIIVNTAKMPPDVDCVVLESAPSLIIKALNEPQPRAKGAPHDGAIEFSEILKIAKKLKHKSFATTFPKMVTQILGTAKSIGCSIRLNGDLMSPHDVSKKVINEEIECNEP
eukprot:gnl/Chilomastix_caulleri/185.p1 GENE.gnl/Chilomastix_caulleri/185~~gnl/Chilomastix_caulleri/185.p1  ORF type:complete len:165 (+),score=45.17 gnl/Chilomastix_caulleri/185:45-539(+)